jgi:hypothetical protein
MIESGELARAVGLAPADRLPGSAVPEVRLEGAKPDRDDLIYHDECAGVECPIPPIRPMTPFNGMWKVETTLAMLFYGMPPDVINYALPHLRSAAPEVRAPLRRPLRHMTEP